MKFYDCTSFSKYELTKDGIVRNKETKHICKQSLTKKGYPRVFLYDADVRRHSICVHRLVMLTFKPIPNYESMQVNHKDGNKKNNNIFNLEWVTAKENMQHAFVVLHHSNQKPIYIYCAFTGKYIGKFRSIAQAARELQVSDKQLSIKYSYIQRAIYIASTSYRKYIPESELRPVYIITLNSMIYGYTTCISKWCSFNEVNFGSLSASVSLGNQYKGYSYYRSLIRKCTKMQCLDK